MVHGEASRNELQVLSAAQLAEARLQDQPINCLTCVVR